jgi:lipoate---protein ligase
MYCIILESDNPFFNLAIEEILLKNKREEYLILGINKPSVIIGKHQAAHREINTKFVVENDIPVVRRISGGGTVFHDKGNLNFTFIRQSEEGKQVDFRKYTLPVIEFLSSIGVEAKFEGKNDIKTNGFKISGNAEHVHRNRVLHHGTLLFSTSLEMMRNALRKDTSLYSSRAVASNPAPVINLKEMLKGFRDIYEFRSGMMNFFLNNLPENKIYNLSHSDIEATESLILKKYRTWEWNWAYGPDYQFVNKFQSEGDHITCRLSVKEGIIRECLIEGSSEMVNAGKKMTGCRHMPDDLRKVFREENFPISENEVFNFF